MSALSPDLCALNSHKIIGVSIPTHLMCFPEAAAAGGLDNTKVEKETESH